MNKSRYIYIYICIVLIISLFLVTPLQVEEAYLGIKSIIYLIFPVSKEVIITVITSIMILYIFFRKKNINLDKIALLLFFRLIICLIPIIFTNPEQFWGSYFVQVADFLIYVVARNIILNDKSEKIIVNIFLTTAIIMSIQLIISYFNIIQYLKYSDYSYKYLLVIPYGGSNFIACFILPIFISYLYTNNIIGHKKIMRNCILTVMIIGILLTKSRTGIIFMTIAIVYKMLIHNRKNAFLSLIKSMIIITIIGISMYKFKDILFKFISGFSDIASGGIIDRLTSNRLSLWGEYFIKIFNSPFIGYGPSYSTGQLRAHNIIIDILYQSGIVGLGMFIVLFTTWLNKIKNYKKNEFVLFSFIYCIVTVINSMLEIAILTSITADFTFLTIMGLSMSRVQSLQANNKDLIYD